MPNRKILLNSVCFLLDFFIKSIIMIGKKGGRNEKMGLKKNMELSKMGQIVKLVRKLSKKEAEQNAAQQALIHLRKSSKS